MDDESTLAAARVVASLRARLQSCPGSTQADEAVKFSGPKTPAKRCLETELQGLADLVDSLPDRRSRSDLPIRDEAMASDDDVGRGNGDHGVTSGKEGMAQDDQGESLLDDMLQELANINAKLFEQNELQTAQRHALSELTTGLEEDPRLEALLKAFVDVEQAQKSMGEMASTLRSNIRRLQRSRKPTTTPQKGGITTLFAQLSNQMRTPINAITGMTQMILGTELTTNQQDMLEAVRTSTDCLATLIDEVTTFSKIECGRLIVEEIPLRLRHTILRALEPLVAEAKDKGQSISLHMNESVPDYITGDSFRLREVIQCLVKSLISTAGRGRGISLNVRTCPDPQAYEEDASSIEFMIKFDKVGEREYSLTQLLDTLHEMSECGMPPEYVSSVDLRLLIVKCLVEHMGGRLWVDRGTHNIIHFTIQSRMAPHNDYCKAIQRRPGPVRSYRVLVVDEEQSGFGLYVKPMLEEMGLQVIIMGIEQALRLLMQEAGRGLGIPKGSVVVGSIHTATKLRARGCLRALPPVVLVMDPSISVRIEELLEMDIASYVAAPGSVATLGMAMPDALERTPDPTLVTYDGWEPLEVLVADDNRVNQKLSAKMLEKYHCSVTVVSNGSEAVEAVKGKRFDAILMDILMPVMVK